MIPPCTSPDKKHNFYPNGPCLNLCGLNQADLRPKKVEIDYVRPKEKTLFQKIHDDYGLKYSLITKIKNEIGEQALLEVYAMSIQDRGCKTAGFIINQWKKLYNKTKWQ